MLEYTQTWPWDVNKFLERIRNLVPADYYRNPGCWAAGHAFSISLDRLFNLIYLAGQPVHMFCDWDRSRRWRQPSVVGGECDKQQQPSLKSGYTRVHLFLRRAHLRRARQLLTDLRTTTCTTPHFLREHFMFTTAYILNCLSLHMICNCMY